MITAKPTGQYKTINTFSRLPSLAQICSYVVVTLQSVVFYLMIRPNLQSTTASIVLTVLFTVTLAMLVITTFVCSFIDPSDPVMMEYKKQNGKKISSNLKDLLYCDFCMSYVTPQARHCKQCDRCVQKFDHHCMWINNCVGQRNYKIFVAMIISTCLNLSMYLASVVVISIERKWTAFMGFIITCWVVMVIVAVLWFLLFNLNLLHFYLMCKGYTTYQFIMVRREEQRQKQMEKNQALALQRQQKIKKIVEQTRKKIHSQKKVENRLQKIVPSVNQQTIQKKEKQQNEVQTNAKINMASKNSRELADLEATGVMIKNPSKVRDANNIFTNQFDQKAEDGSEISSINVGSTNQMKNSNIKNQIERNDIDIISSSEDNQQIKISKFFTKNKSFGLLFSNKVAEKPHKKQKNNISLMIERTQKQQLHLKNKSAVKSSNQIPQLKNRMNSKESSKKKGLK